MSKVGLTLLVALVAAGSVLGGCAQADGVERPAAKTADSTKDSAAQGEVAEDAAKDDAEDAIPVAALPIERGRIESLLRYSTNLEAENEVEVLAEAARKVEQLYVEEGDYVRRGQHLLRLQEEEQRTALQRIESQLERARREYERQKNLYSQELISEQAYTQATYEIEQLELARQDAKRELGYATVKAPISGVVTERRVSLGDHVQRNDPLFSIVDFDSIVARVYVPEKELLRLEVGQVARLSAQGTAMAKEATIERIAPIVDPRSGTVKVTLQIPKNQGLLPGMYVEVDLVAAVEEQALLVPKRALVYDQDQVFVFRVKEEDRVERLLVQPRLEDRFFVQIADRLEAGDRIVVAGQAGLKDGARVRLLDAREALATLEDLADVRDAARAAGLDG